MKLEGPILVGTDFSAASDEALRQGTQGASERPRAPIEWIVCVRVPGRGGNSIRRPRLDR